MDALTGIRVFCTVAEFKSFVAAADRLNLSPAMVSKHVMRLEDRLGSRLLNRSTRRVSLTEIGSTYYSQAKQILEGLDEVEAVVSNVTVVPRGSLRVSAPMWVASRAFASFLAEYRAQYPQVCFDFDLTGRVANLVEEGFDLALRATAQPERLDPGLIARPLTDVVFHLVAAPRYLEQAGRPARLADLNGHSFLMPNGVKPRSAFKFEGPAGAELVKFNTVMESNNESLLHQAALAGLGMTFLPRLMVEADLREGALENVLPESAQVRAQLYAVYPSRKYLSAKVRTFIDLLVRRVEIDVRGERQALVTAQGR